ncbi:MAG TPA: DNA polymerase IV [Candidatus Omnitrophota bacterium]|nr:DNA polymerase IV [Candidatus Omnitrophota bacterium]HRZ14597.1 DNA polymerase IV [Candidatus Omnitrophota bacterium]
MEPIILHMDMDAFFASVEQATTPRLAGKPLIVGSRGRKNNTVVAACSYEAKAFGVESGMPTWRAFKLCPHAEFVSADSGKYLYTAHAIFEMLKRYSPQGEMASIDEFYLDLSNDTLCAAERIAVGIKEQIRREFHITCSIGIAPAKIIAKIAAKAHKPDGLVVLEEKDVPRFLEELPVGKVPGIGPRLQEHLHGMSIFNCGQLAGLSEAFLVQRFGKAGVWLYETAHGRDSSEVGYWAQPELPPKSVSHSYTLEKELYRRDAVLAWIRMLCEMVAYRLRKDSLESRGVQLYLRGSAGAFSRQKSFTVAVSDAQALYRRSLAILESFPAKRLSCRALGVCAFSLSGAQELCLFPEDRKQNRLIRAVDRINERFGEWSIYPAVIAITR